MTKSFEFYLREAQALRNDAIASETRLLLFLVEFEASDTWRDAGVASFEMLIRQYKLTRTERYTDFRAALALLDDAVVSAIGANAAIQASKIRSASTRRDYVAEATMRVKEDGFPWSADQAERARIRVSPDPPKPLMRVARVSRTEKQLAEAEQLIETLREENTNLKKENQLLKKMLGKKASTLSTRPGE